MGLLDVLIDAYKRGAGLLAPTQSDVDMRANLPGLLADFTPVIGDAKSAYDGVQSARQGDYLGAGLGALGALPLVPNMAGIFIGKGAKTWDALSASKALEMEKAGTDPRKIWKETGNWKGPDGKWRQEISDSNSRPGHQLYSWGESTDLKQGNSTVVRRQKALLHPDLSAAYPESKKIGVFVKPRMKGGSYDEEFKNITAGAEKNGAVDRSTMLHELQHSIQGNEGWARGGSPENAPILNEEMLAQVRAQKKDLGIDPYQIMNKKSGGYFVSPDELSALEKYNKLNAVEDQILSNRLDPYEAYRRLAGEAEARATQARMNMDMAQRRATFPADSYDVPLDQLIIRGLLDK